MKNTYSRFNFQDAHSTSNRIKFFLHILHIYSVTLCATIRMRLPLVS